MPTCTRCGFESDRAVKFCPDCGADWAVTTVAQEQRKTVTVLFCDLAGSTAIGEALDPERVRTLLARYFERMSAIVEHHGGSVEKFIGDAVMAVFGVPAVHEDDALRAVRAAEEMRDALPGLGLEGRIGVMTGEVVTGTEERLATGDAVNVAARLEQAAQPGQVLIGQPTHRLVHDAVEVEPVEPLALKGKAEFVAAYRLLHVLEVPERRHDTRFVGREHELTVVRETWKRVLAGQRCELVTVVGEAGVGKSRLIAEAVASIDARVVRGRCLPYGDGVTYWPVVEVLKQLELRPPGETAAAAIRSLLGESEDQTSAEEIAWAFRKTLEHAATERPLVVLFDDIQWGDETFHDLIEHVTLLSTGAPMLLLCMARPELVERRPSWPVALHLEPLGTDDVEELLGEQVVGELRATITRAAGGNPLFIREMLAMTAETDGTVVVPPTLHALLAERLDRLESDERSVLERGAVEGEIFHRGAVQALSPDEARVTPRLATLVRKELIRPDRPQLAGEDGFRFRHLLIRDAAYAALPKAERAYLHARFASWLEQRGSELVELDEILGYHLEQACGYLAELGRSEDGTLAAAARRHLAASGRRAAARKDFGAAARLLERAAALVPSTEIDVALELQLTSALNEMGKGADALERSEALASRAAARGDVVGELCGTLQAGIIRMGVEPEGATETLETLVAQALPVFNVAGDDIALYTAYRAQGWVAFTRAKTDAALEAWELAGTHARQAGISDDLLGWRAISRLYGTTPVTEVLTWLEATELQEGRDYWLRAARAIALAMLGRFDEARTTLTETRADLAERGGHLQLAVITGIESAMAELWAGNPIAAAEFAAEGCKRLEEFGEEAFLSSAAGTLASALYALDRLDEADAWANRAAELGASDDMFTQLLWRQTKAKLLGRRGEHTLAERLAREAVSIGDVTDYLDGQGDAYADLAEVLLLDGKRDEAAAALEQALDRYERKGNVGSAERVRTRLRELDLAV